jgi:alpha-galactosidase
MTLAMVVLFAQMAASGNGGWTLSTADTVVNVAVENGRPALARVEGTDGFAWLSKTLPERLPETVWFGGKESKPNWTFVGAEAGSDGTPLALRFENEQPRMVLKSIWRGRPGRGPIEHWIEIENEDSGAITIPQVESLVLSGLTPEAGSELHWVKRGASNASTEGGCVSQAFNAQTDVNLVSNCDDGASPVPWLAVQSGDKRGLYVGWEFSGLGRISAKADGDALDVAVGLLPEFKTDIKPGETFLVPPAFVGCYAGDLDEGSYLLHQWILKYLRPSVPDDGPDPILAFNLYLDAGGAGAKEADVLRSAQFCKDIGFEAFMPDAMWFPACGDWRWDPARFPKGIAPIEEFVHGSGMKMALWCAWTNGGISEDPGALSVRGPVGHPDWFNADYATDWKPGPFFGAQVCLACPEAEAWETQKTQWLVANHKLDYLKHDCGPIVMQCNKTTHRHGYGVDASYWATTAYYRIQEKLRAANPRLILENCSGGGHMKDFGIVRRTHYTVTTDTLSNLPDRQSIYDSTYAFPPMLLQAYTYEWEYKVPGDDPGPFLWRSAMMGAWQIDPTRSKDWSPEAKESAKKAAQTYKDWVRPMLKDVKVHHVLPRPDGVHWDGLFYWSPGLRRGTLYVFRPDAAEERQTVRLKGLEAGKKYWVWSEDGSVEAGERSGEELMAAGLSPTLATRYSCDLVYVRDAELGKPEGMKAP